MKRYYILAVIFSLAAVISTPTPTNAAEGNLAWQNDASAGWLTYGAVAVTSNGAYSAKRNSYDTVEVIRRTPDNSTGNTKTLSVPTGAWVGAYPPYIAADTTGVYVALTSAVDASLNYGTLSIAKLSPDLSIVLATKNDVTPGFVNVSRVELDNTGVYVIGGSSAPSIGWRVEKWDRDLSVVNPLWVYDSQQSGGNACDYWGPRASVQDGATLYFGGCRLDAGSGQVGNRIERVNKTTGLLVWKRLESYGTGAIGTMALTSANLYTASSNSFWGGTSVPLDSRLEKRPLNDAPAVWTLNDVNKDTVALAVDGTSGIYRGYVTVGDSDYRLKIDKLNLSDGFQISSKTILTGLSQITSFTASLGLHLIANNMTIDGTGIYVAGRSDGPFFPLNGKVPRIEKYGHLGPQNCGTTPPDADGNTYETVVIGDQCWMKENMRVGEQINAPATPSDPAKIEKYCYGNDSSNCTANHPNYPDGGLYTWDEAMQGANVEGAQGICPVGWHIPTDAEWHTLEDYLKDSGQSCEANRYTFDCKTAGTKLKPSPLGSAGFEANLSGDLWSPTNQFLNRDGDGYFWSSSFSGGNPWFRNIDLTETGVMRVQFYKTNASPVRCLQDAGAVSSSTLKICRDSCGSGARYDTGGIADFAVTDTTPVTLYACYGTGTCSSGDSAVSGTWQDKNSPVNSVTITSPSGTNTTVSASGTTSGKENIDLTYSGTTITAVANGTVCIPSCGNTADKCPTETWSNGCGGTCTGTKNCSSTGSWREVAP